MMIKEKLSLLTYEDYDWSSLLVYACLGKYCFWRSNLGQSFICTPGVGLAANIVRCNICAIFWFYSNIVKTSMSTFFLQSIVKQSV